MLKKINVSLFSKNFFIEIINEILKCENLIQLSEKLEYKKKITKFILEQTLKIISSNHLIIPLNFLNFYNKHQKKIESIRLIENYVFIETYILGSLFIEDNFLSKHLSIRYYDTVKNIYEKFPEQFDNIKYRKERILKKLVDKFTFFEEVDNFIILKNEFNTKQNLNFIKKIDFNSEKNLNVIKKKKKKKNIEKEVLSELKIAFSNNLKENILTFDIIKFLLKNFNNGDKKNKNRYSFSLLLFSETLRNQMGNNYYNQLLHLNIPCFPSSSWLIRKNDNNNFFSGIQFYVLKKFLEVIKLTKTIDLTKDMVLLCDSTDLTPNLRYCTNNGLFFLFFF
jgi:hypothetical protein